MPYVPPQKKAADKTYVAPSERKVDTLAPENFPSLGAKVTAAPVSPVAPVAPTMSFLGRIKEAEEARQKQQEAEMYDPAKLETMTRAQLEAEGWAVLPLPSKNGPANRLNPSPQPSLS
jgi:hypothetical protein